MTKENGISAPSAGTQGSAYEAATLGFRNYWYPVFSSREVREKPRMFVVCGDRIVFLRRNGKAYAVQDRCAHRGTSLALFPEKTYPFKDSNTITCPYHGWTYDVRDGMCVANVCEGPDSSLVGKFRLRTYPVEERKGIVWIWMGDMAPVPVEEDIPKLILREDTIVKMVNRIKRGNWRWHAENVMGGHAPQVHMNTPRNWFQQPTGPDMPGEAHYLEDMDSKGIWGETYGSQTRASGKPLPWAEFPGLGRWFVPPLWRRLLIQWWIRPVKRSVRFDVEKSLLCLPGYFRPGPWGWPTSANVAYEYYVPIDETHYEYNQITLIFKKNPIQAFLRQLQYYFWAKPLGPVMLNNEDAALVEQTTAFQAEDRHNWVPITSSKNDHFFAVWRRHCDENARGVGTKYHAAANVSTSGISDSPDEVTQAVPVLESGD